jgi:hypothetical protein
MTFRRHYYPYYCRSLPVQRQCPISEDLWVHLKRLSVSECGDGMLELSGNSCYHVNRQLHNTQFKLFCEINS